MTGDIMRIDDKHITLASRLWGEVKIVRAAVCGWMPAAPRGALKRDQRYASLRRTSDSDHLLLLDGDKLSGSMLSTDGRNGGGLFGLSSLSIAVGTNERRTTIPIERIAAANFATPQIETAMPNCWLGFGEGSLLAVTSIMQMDDEVSQIVTVAGAEFNVATSRLVSAAILVQPRHANVRYISELPAIGYKSFPMLTRRYPLGKNSNVLGGRLRSRGTIAMYGLGMHGTSRTAFELPNAYLHFRAEVALDDYAGQLGSVVYRILVECADESEGRRWNLAYTSPVLRGGDDPLPITVDVTDALRILLVTESADRGDVCDHANWLNARLCK